MDYLAASRRQAGSEDGMSHLDRRGLARRRAFRVVIVALLAMTLLQRPSSGASCLRIGSPEGAGAGGELQIIVERAFQRTQLCAEFVRAPVKRLGTYIENGDLDGVIVAMPDSRLLPKHYVPISTPLVTFTASLYWRPGLPVPQGRTAEIGILLGWDWARDAVAAIGAQAVEVPHNEQLFNMLQEGRLDGFILQAQSVSHFTPRYPSLATLQSKVIAPLPVRLWLHTRNAPVAAAIDRAIAGLHADGFADHTLDAYAQGRRSE